MHEVNLYFTAYSEYVDGAEFKEKGDEWLPLGLMYQNHVGCFARYLLILYIYSYILMFTFQLSARQDDCLSSHRESH